MLRVPRPALFYARIALPLNEQWIVANAEGESLEYKSGNSFPTQPQYALCRCGQSSNKPFCDGTHAKIQFDGTETASREPYLEQAETIEGQTMVLTDSESLCPVLRSQRPGLEPRQANGQPRCAATGRV